MGIELTNEYLEGLKSGDQKSLEKMFKAYHRYLYVIAFQYVSDENRSRDIIQDIFYDLWNRRSHLNIKGSLKSYLRQAVINRALATIRKDKNMSFMEHNTLPENNNSNSVEVDYEQKELEEVVKKAVDTLPERCKEIFYLSRFEGLSHKEIAARLEISTKTIENQMTKALKSIRLALKDYGILSLIFFLIRL